MKKILSLVLVLSMVLGSMSFAFAGQSFSDVTDEDVLAAVERLSAVGIVDGYEDGSYKPENEISRAEFAKLLVVALGLESAADAAKGSSQFTDVDGSEWYAGYVNIAVGQSVIKGYPDGSFNPGSQVSYAEAITMLVRALGYKDEFLSGSWPGNFVAKAAELDLSDGVEFSTNGKANRGDVAVLLNNTLDANVITQNSYGDNNNFVEGDTLLEEKIKITKYEDAVITDIPRISSTLDKDEIRFAHDGDTHKKSIASDVNVESLLGLKANVYVNKDGEAFFVELSDSYTVLYDVVAEDTISNFEFDLVVADDTFEFANDGTDNEASIYINNDSKTEAEFETAVNAKGLFGKFVLDAENKVVLVDAFDWTSKYDAAIVKEVEESRNIITYVKDSASEKELKLESADAFVIQDTKGNAMTIAEIEKNDVIYVAEGTNKATKDDTLYVFVVNNSVAGELEEYEGLTNLVIGEESYDLGRVNTISTDEDESITALSTAKLDDVLDAEVTALLDIVGNVRHITSAVDETSSDDMYGLVVAKDNADWGTEKVKIFTTSKEEVVYELDFPTSYAGNVYADLAADNFVKYTVDKDGEINSITIQIADVTTNAGYTSMTDVDFGSDSITPDATEYFTADSTIIFNFETYATSNDLDDIELVEWATIASKDDVDGFVFVDADSKDLANALVFVAGLGSAVNDTTYYGYVLDVKTTSDGDKAKIAVSGEEEDMFYILDSSISLDQKQVIEFQLNTDKELVVADQSTHTVTGYVYAIDEDYVQVANLTTDVDSDGVYDEADGDVLTLADTTWYKTSSDTVYYDSTTEKDFFDLEEGTVVKMLIDGRTVKATKIN